MAEDIQGAAVKYLLSLPDVVNSVGKFHDSNKPFIFRDEMLVNLEEKQYSAISAIVVQDGGPVAVPTITKYRGRRLRVNIWANGTRDILGNLVDPKTVRLKLNETFQALDKYLHRTNPEIVLWSSVYTISSDRLIDLSEPISVVDGDGIMTASVYYAVFF